MFICFIAYSIMIILAIIGFYIEIQEINENRKRVFDEYQKIKDLTLKEIIENRKRVFDEYQKIKDLTLKEIIENAKNSDDINNISINILKNIIQENEEK